jgi:AcrR family transcriptional regulator
MTIQERRARERAERRHLIATTARTIAEREGWDAVTTRRLSTEIEYSQPVIYKHFASLDEITDAVALDGFIELAAALRSAREAAANGSSGGADGDSGGAGGDGDAVRAVAHRYAAFAADSPALYDAMFLRRTRLPFGSDSSPELAAAFEELRAAVGPLDNDGDDDATDGGELLTETLWAALHGLIVLDRNGRLRPERQVQRIDLLVGGLVPRRDIRS